jgi:hypothetical protein
MAEIKIKDLRPAGSEFFVDSESYLSELSEDELNITGGGDFATFASLSAVVFLSLSIFTVAKG